MSKYSLIIKSCFRPLLSQWNYFFVVVNWFWKISCFWAVERAGLLYLWLGSLSFTSSSSRTDRWVHFQQNAVQRMFVHPLIMHGIDHCYQFTWTSGEFSAQCLSKRFLKKFAVLLLTTSFGNSVQVVILIGLKYWVTDVYQFHNIIYPLYSTLTYIFLTLYTFLNIFIVTQNHYIFSYWYYIFMKISLS